MCVCVGVYVSCFAHIFGSPLLSVKPFFFHVFLCVCFQSDAAVTVLAKCQLLHGSISIVKAARRLLLIDYGFHSLALEEEARAHTHGCTHTNGHFSAREQI